MKSAILSLIAIAAAVPAGAHGHGHDHAKRMHKHVKREADYVVVYETVTVNSDGVRVGTATGTSTVYDLTTAVVAGPVDTPKPKQSSSTAPAAITPAAVTTPIAQDAQKVAQNTLPAAAATTPAAATTSSAKPAAAPANSGASTGSSSSSSNSGSIIGSTSGSTGSGIAGNVALSAGTLTNPLGNYANPSVKFVDGFYPCGSPPLAMQGVLSLPYLGMAGFTSLQIGNAGGSQCTPGTYCSYACQPGMLKTQWPSSQPSDGQSRGGLMCKDDGFLYRTNQNTDYLCEWGYEGAYVTNSISQGVAICQTDYPGSENMDLPTWAAAGAQDVPLSVVNQATYYQWQGKPTSSQFYVNKAGVSQSQGCQWNSPGSNMGNFAPLIFGAGYVPSDGISYLSITKNPESTDVANYSVTFKARQGSQLNGDCVYSNGAFSGSSATANGCTVGCKGACEYVIY
ncbi:putative secreted beta-glucosidase sim1 [Savitreella phatthalungensis]